MSNPLCIFSQPRPNLRHNSAYIDGHKRLLRTRLPRGIFSALVPGPRRNGRLCKTPANTESIQASGMKPGENSHIAPECSVIEPDRSSCETMRVLKLADGEDLDYQGLDALANGWRKEYEVV